VKKKNVDQFRKNYQIFFFFLTTLKKPFFERRKIEEKKTLFGNFCLKLKIFLSEPEDTVEPHGKPCLHFIKFCWHTLFFWPQDLGDARSEDAGRKCPDELWYKR